MKNPIAKQFRNHETNTRSQVIQSKKQELLEKELDKEKEDD